MIASVSVFDLCSLVTNWCQIIFLSFQRGPPAWFCFQQGITNESRMFTHKVDEHSIDLMRHYTISTTTKHRDEQKCLPEKNSTVSIV